MSAALHSRPDLQEIPIRPSVHPIRFLAAAALAVAVLGASGCSWFRKGDELYAQSPENRPLEVPPDLNLPDTSGAMKLPGGDTTQSVSRSSVGASATSAPDNTGFTVAGERDAVFDRIGEVRSEEHTSELQSLMRISYAVFCLKKKKTQVTRSNIKQTHKTK